MASSGFSVTIGVVDQTGPTLTKASKSVDAYRQRWLTAQKTLKDLDKTGREALKGIVDPRAAGALANFAFAATGAGVKAGRAFDQMGKSVDDTVDKLSRFAPQLQAFVGIATVAGIGKLVNDFGRFGIETTKTAAALDLNVKDVPMPGLGDRRAVGR